MISRKYVKDYRLENIPDKKGKIKTKAVYAGEYFRFDKSGEEVRIGKRNITVAAVLALVAFVMGIVFYRNTGFSAQYYTLVPFICCFFPVLYLIIALISLSRVKDKVTREVKDGLHDRVASCSIAILVLDGWTVSALILASVLKITGTITKPVTVYDIVFILNALLLLAAALTAFLSKKHITMKAV